MGKEREGSSRKQHSNKREESVHNKLACICVCVCVQNQELTAQYEKKQKELKNLCIEEGQVKRAQGMKLDKESKQNIRRQMKREMKEQHVQEVLGYLMP